MTNSDELLFSTCVSGRIDDGVLVVTIDNPPVNAASAAMRAGLLGAVHAANNDGSVKAVIVTGNGRIFVSGADIGEFGKPPVDPSLPDVLEAIEQSAKPVIAAINGAALGGGLEIALACHYRIASPAASLGLPEVKLGIVPGAGGTQRLPRLTGLAVALDMIANGRAVKAAEALASGIIDAIADNPLADALGKLKSDEKPSFRKTSDLAVQAESTDKLEPIASKIRSRARGLAAPLEAVRLVLASATTAFHDGLADERNTFIRLRESAESAALRYVFFAEREAAKVDGVKDVAPRSVKKIGIVGTGLMGSGIVVSALDAGYHVTGVEQTDEAAQKGLERIVGLLERNLKSGRIDEAGLAARLSRLSVSGDFAGLADADLVIEAVFDEMAVKTGLFRRLDGIVRPDAILATNTSYLDPDLIAAATQYPERVLGLHFFSPANIMRLLEVVRCARTTPDVLATGLAVAKKLGKLAIVSGVTEGFIGNSIFSAYRREAEFLVEDGASPEAVDAAMEDYGMAMGPFAVFDMAGLEIAWARRKRQAATRDPSARYVDIADRLCEAGRFGQKTGRGWYRYENGKRQVDFEVAEMIDQARSSKGIVPRLVAAKEITDRLLAAMASEGKRLLGTGVAARAGDIDLVMINGYGFPSHKGGPMYQAGLADSPAI
ncbi:MAG: 3-hydroxyacyl-CoA dehydrogenase [Rhizobium sp.]|nr:3-hydroxyacyl-CoA dehydrogenase [Rhizobium sp.]